MKGRLGKRERIGSEAIFERVAYDGDRTPRSSARKSAHGFGIIDPVEARNRITRRGWKTALALFWCKFFQLEQLLNRERIDQPLCHTIGQRWRRAIVEQGLLHPRLCHTLKQLLPAKEPEGTEARQKDDKKENVSHQLLVERLHNAFDHLLGIGQQHDRLRHVEDVIVNACITNAAHRTFDEENLLGLVHIEHGHAVNG